MSKKFVPFRNRTLDELVEIIGKLERERDEAVAALNRANEATTRTEAERDYARSLADACCRQRDASDRALFEMERERDDARFLAECRDRELTTCERERDEAREVARDCFWDCGQYMGEYLFNKHYGDYRKRYAWLPSAGADNGPGADGREADD